MSLLKKNQDLLLKQAFDFYAIQKCEALPNSNALNFISFSDLFEEKMQRLITRQKKGWFYLVNTVAKRVAIIVLALLISLTVTTFSVKALRETAIDFITEVYERFTRIIFVDDTAQNSEDNSPALSFEPIFPDYIPDGFELSNSMDLDVLVMREYKNNDHWCIYRQRINDGTVMRINTEQKGHEKIFINDFEGFIFTFSNETTITFTNGEYIFSISGTIERNELIKISESVPIK